AKFAKKNTDLNLFEDERVEEAEAPSGIAKADAKNGNTRRGTHVELHESKPVQELLGQLNRKGLPMEHYATQDKPLFELIEGDREGRVHPLFSVSEILATVKEIGRRGIQLKRFKGLGEMNPKELFDTTMNPETRKLLRIEITDAVEAEDMFTKLMGDEVPPRRQFIEDNALNVRNLDI
ncbi:MAG: DNA gyrase subunit B, partial [Verrucomicrobiia bacterium]